MQRVSIMPLGAGCQVGRSCLILTINNKKIMLDCGLMINKGGHDALPLLDKVNAQQLSMVIITHAHLDHCGALPYFLANTKYKKKVFMTRPTCDIYKYLVKDTLKVRNQQQALFTGQQIQDSQRRIVKVDFGVQVQQEGIKITPYVAGHIVGAAMFLIEFDGVKVLYTGDYSCEQDRYIMKAEVPQTNVDVLISESTFGTRSHQDRHIRQQRFRQYVRKIVKGGGKCLLPVFSAGRAQQLLFILDQYWQQNKQELGNIHIYYTVSLIQKCKDIYQTYIDMLSKKIKQRFYKEINNPFKYRYIHYLKSNQRIYSQQKNPMVVMCTPGMLQSGQSRTLLERWCHDPRNGVIITGYCAEGSIASNLKKGDLINSMNADSKPISVNLNVQQISFAAHADIQQTTQFIKKVKPLYVVFVHGSSKNAQALRTRIQSQFPDIKQVKCPRNQQQLIFDIQITQRYQIAGKLKNKIQYYIKNINKEDKVQEFQGYLVNTGDQKILVDKEDKDKIFPQLEGIKIRQKIIVNYVGSLTLAQILAFRIFGDARTDVKGGDQVLYIKNQQIQMTLINPGRTALVQFISSPKNDIIADQFCYLLSNILYDPLLEQSLTKNQTDFTQSHRLIFTIIKQQYPQSIINQGLICIKKDNQTIAMMNLYNKKVDTNDQYLKMRLLALMDDYIKNQMELE